MLVENLDGGFSDEELEELALSAAGEDKVDKDAVPLRSYLVNAEALLPEWYMAPMVRRKLGVRGRIVVWGMIGAFLVIEACGLCSAYGQFPLH